MVGCLDRLGHNLKDLLAFACELEAQDVQFAALMENMDPTTPMG